MYLLGSDVTQDADGQARTGERMSFDEPLGHLELVTNAAHFVFEQPLEWFAQLQLHFFGKSAYVMMTFDGHSRDAETLDTVGVDGSLG